MDENWGCSSNGIENCCKNSEESHRASPSVSTRGTKLCTKCKTCSSSACVRQNEALCSSCLVESVQSKFRYALKTKQVIAPGDKVVAITSGSFLSQALLDLLLVHLNPSEARPERGKVQFQLEVVWVDESCLRAGNIDFRQTTTDEAAIELAVGALANQRNVSSVSITRLGLEDVLGSAASIEDRQSELMSMLQGIGYASGREDLVKHFKRLVAIMYAKSNGLNKLVLDESASVLAAHIIGSTAKARGFDLPGDLHYVDNRLGRDGPTIIRPLKELHNKEIGLYCHFRDLPVCTDAAGIETSGTSGSINDAAERFVIGLQKTFPSGLSSILSTGAKLEAFSWNNSLQDSKNWELCGVCLAPIAPIKHQDKAVDALDDWWKSHFCFCCCRQLILQFNSPGSHRGDKNSLITLRDLLGRIHEHSLAMGIHL